MAGSLAGWVFDKQADHPPGVGSGGQGGGECRGFGLCELSKAPSVTHSPGLPCPRPQPLFLPTAPLLAPGPRVEPISREPRASALPSHSGVVLTKRKGAPLQAGTQMPPGPSSCGGWGGDWLRPHRPGCASSSPRGTCPPPVLSSGGCQPACSLISGRTLSGGWRGCPSKIENQYSCNDRAEETLPAADASRVWGLPAVAGARCRSSGPPGRKPPLGVSFYPVRKQHISLKPRRTRPA